MNDIITDLKALQEETLINLQSSKANNTIRAYKSDFHDFELFCAYRMDLSLFQQNLKLFHYILTQFII